MSLPALNQLRLAEAWGQDLGDRLCGPLAFYALLKSKSARGLRASGSELKSYKSFQRTFFPDFGEGLILENGVRALAQNFASELRSYKIHDLHRRGAQRNLARDWGLRFQRASRGKRTFLIQVGAYHATVKKGANIWRRGLGHFLVGIESSRVQEVENPFFELRYWDPWDGREHRAIVFEELYRDFAALSQGGIRRSPSGHKVMSPFLCLLAPHLDLYDPKVYFAQRYIYILERAYL